MNISKEANRRIDYVHIGVSWLVTVLIMDYIRERMPWLTAGETNRIISYGLSAAAAWVLFILPAFWLRKRYLRIDEEPRAE